MLEHLTIQNFKSFADASIPLGKLSLLVGANGAGKSNLFDALRVLHGLAQGNTLAQTFGGRIEGGSTVWPGIRGGASEATRQQKQDVVLATAWRLGQSSIRHTVTMSLQSEPLILSERIVVEGVGQLVRQPADGNGQGGRARSLLAEVELIIAAPPVLDAARALRAAMSEMTFLDVRPSSMRDYVPAGMTDIGASAENVSAVLARIAEDPNRREDLGDWLSELCGTDVVGIEFERTRLDDVMMSVREASGALISARSLSDGTLRFLGEIAALWDRDRAELTLLEEIENGLHPARVHLLVDYLVSRTHGGQRQVIATTHSPTILEALPPEVADDVLVFGKHDGATVVRALGSLPKYREVRERRGLDELFTTKWLEGEL